MKYTTKSVPRRMWNVGEAAACSMGAFALSMAAGMTGSRVLLVPAGGCAATAVYKMGRAVLPESDKKDR